ncbi:uncharacterized protein LOC119256289 isoform X7 [Talpa occidentalis]|uniref:uncharacterized protein LOC119256289 isoform X7 n=1 Tax=Talpa occidentalis TaxID=50954 RepID=UPI0023F801A3|nr:uncharacterized protein LOC119256289 isoform X7 [Talpa occidentalis]
MHPGRTWRDRQPVHSPNPTPKIYNWLQGGCCGDIVLTWRAARAAEEAPHPRSSKRPRGRFLSPWMSSGAGWWLWNLLLSAIPPQRKSPREPWQLRLSPLQRGGSRGWDEPAGGRAWAGRGALSQAKMPLGAKLGPIGAPCPETAFQPGWRVLRDPSPRGLPLPQEPFRRGWRDSPVPELGHLGDVWAPESPRVSRNTHVCLRASWPRGTKGTEAAEIVLVKQPEPRAGALCQER